MEHFIDRFARTLGRRRWNRRDVLQGAVKASATTLVAVSGMSLNSREAEAACGCGGCYSTAGTSGLFHTRADLNVRTEPFTCAPVMSVMPCISHQLRDAYTDQGTYVCNCCGHCSSRWYRIASSGYWVSSVYTEHNDNGCNCCDNLALNGDPVG